MLSPEVFPDMGWLLPPHSSGTRPAHQCDKKGPAHLENSKNEISEKA